MVLVPVVVLLHLLLLVPQLQLQLLLGAVTAAWAAGDLAEALEGLTRGVMHVHPAQQQKKKKKKKTKKKYGEREEAEKKEEKKSGL